MLTSLSADFPVTFTHCHDVPESCASCRSHLTVVVSIGGAICARFFYRCWPEITPVSDYEKAKLSKAVVASAFHFGESLVLGPAGDTHDTRVSVIL